MAGNYDNIDLRYTGNGDYAVAGGDLADTSSDGLLSVQQDLRTVSDSSPDDWELIPGLGAAITELCGEPNNRETAAELHDRLRIAITSMGFVAEQDLDIRVVPIHIYKLMAIIRVNAVATGGNSLNSGEMLVTSFVFDTIERTVTYFEKTPQLVEVE